MVNNMCINEQFDGKCDIKSDQVLTDKHGSCLADYEGCPCFEPGDEMSLLSDCMEGDDDIDF